MEVVGDVEEMEEMISPTTVMEVCVVCGLLIVKNEPRGDEVVEEVGGGQGPSGGYRECFQLFCKLFGVIGPLRRGWEDEMGRRGGGPFCGDCCSQVGILIELHLKIAELEEELRGGKEEMRKKVKASEELVRSGGGIYNETGLFEGIRRQILRSSSLRRKRRIGGGIGGRSSGSIGVQQADQGANLYPVVRISASDIAKAKERLEADNLKKKGDDDMLDLDLVEEPIISTGRGRKRKSGKSKNKRLPPPAKSQRLGLIKTIGEDIVKGGTGSRRSRRKRQTPYEEGNAFSEDQPPKSQKKRLAGKKRRQLPPKSEDKDEYYIPSNDEDFNDDDDNNGDDDVDDEETGGGGNNDDKKPKKKLLRADRTSGNVVHKGIMLYKTNNTCAADVNLTEDFATPIFKCSACPEDEPVFLPLKEMRRHVDQNHTQGTCKLCQIDGFTAHTLKLHMSSCHYKKKRYACAVCGKPELSHSGITVHKWTHFSVQEKLDFMAAGGHIPTESQPGFQVQCEECGQSFRNKNSLVYHRLQKHISTEAERQAAKSVCPECGKAVTSLDQHMKLSHGQVRSHVCLQCGKSFSRKPDLRKHWANVHGTEKPFRCTLCPRAYAFRRNLEEHMKAHLNVRPFPCEHCPVAFVTRTTLKRHTRVYHEAGGPPPKRKSYVRGPAITKFGVVDDVSKEGEN